MRQPGSGRTVPGADYFPSKLVQALSSQNGPQFPVSSEGTSSDPLNLPKKDTYFFSLQTCAIPPGQTRQEHENLIKLQGLI